MRLGHAIDVRAAIEKAREAERLRREEEEERRKQRQKVESEAKYQRVAVDPFDPTQRGKVQGRKHNSNAMPWGKHKGKAISELPTGYIRALLERHADPDCDFKIHQHKLKWWLESELSGRRAAQNTPPRQMHPETAAMAAAAQGGDRKPTEDVRRSVDALRQAAQKPPTPKPAPRPFAMDPELAEIEALLLA
jgi:hypothetical protein